MIPVQKNSHCVCRWVAVVIFRKLYGKHEGEKTVQKIVSLRTSPEKGVHGAVLNEYWMSMTEYKIQEDTGLGRSRIAINSSV